MGLAAGVLWLNTNAWRWSFTPECEG